jgi:hypothetical protein
MTGGPCPNVATEPIRRLTIKLAAPSVIEVPTRRPARYHSAQFHIAMRLQHLKQAAAGLSVDDPERAAAKAVIAGEVDRLKWRL